MIGQRLEFTINKAIKRANDLKHEFLTLENVLLSLIEDKEVSGVLENCGADTGEIKNELNDYLNDKDNFSILDDQQIDVLSKKHFVDENLRELAGKNGIRYQPELSLALQRVIQRAAMHVQSVGKTSIKGVNLLVAFFQEEKSFGITLLNERGVTRLKVLEQVAHSLDRAINTDPVELDDQDSKSQQPRKDTLLDQFGVNLLESAKNGDIDPLVGRESEISRIQEILLRRRKNNPLIVGDAGVGKTALVEGFALQIFNGKTHEFFKDLIIYSLDIATVLAGAKFRGDFEQRLKGILESVVKSKKEGKEIIIFIDEIHTIMGAGATGSGTMDASNLLKPYLSSGKIKIIGSTTYEEYRKFIEKDAAFRRRFQKIDIDEPSSEEAVKILQGIKGTLEDHHGIKISNKVINAAVNLSKKYLFDKKLPDKAIDIIDESCSAKKLSNKNGKSLTLLDLEKVVSKLSGVPTQSINNDEKKVLKSLKNNLKLLIYGQDHAIDTICESILVARSGLGNENKPIASFLFSGPTGVGKTELTKQLALLLGNQFIRFDMSEYMEKHSVSKLIGAPPGYVGHDQGGILTDKVNKNPYSVILLDEIEKAHPDIYNVLLQVMDNGTLTDSLGRVTNFRNTILIFTTNAGAAESEKGIIGLGESIKGGSFKADKVLKNFFSPEFRNRLSGIVRFNYLEKDQMVKIVEKFMFEVQGRLESQGISLDVSNEVLEYLAKIGFDPKMGARPLERCILEKISTPISKILIDIEDKKSKKVVEVRLEKEEIRVSLV